MAHKRKEANSYIFLLLLSVVIVGAAMHWAAESGAVDVMQLLALEGASRTSRSERGFTPLYSLVHSDQTTDIQKALGLYYLFSFPEWCTAEIINARSARRSGGASRETPLMLATRRGLVNTVRALLSTGDVIDVTNEQMRGSRDKSPLEICSTALSNARHTLSKQKASEPPNLQGTSTVSPAFNFGMDLSRLRQYTFDHPQWQEIVEEDYVQPSVEDYCKVYGLKVSEIFNDAVVSMETTETGPTDINDGKKHVQASNIVTFNGKREYANIPKAYFDAQQRSPEVDPYTWVAVYEAIQRMLNNRIARQRGQPALSENELVQLFSDNDHHENTSNKKSKKAKPRRTSEKTNINGGEPEHSSNETPSRNMDKDKQGSTSTMPKDKMPERDHNPLDETGMPFHDPSTVYARVNTSEPGDYSDDEWVKVGEPRITKSAPKGKSRKDRKEGETKTDSRPSHGRKENKSEAPKKAAKQNRREDSANSKSEQLTKKVPESGHPEKRIVSAGDGSSRSSNRAVGAWSDLVKKSNKKPALATSELNQKISARPVPVESAAQPSKDNLVQQSSESPPAREPSFIDKYFPELTSLNVQVDDLLGLGDVSKLSDSQLEGILQVLRKSETVIEKEVAARKMSRATATNEERTENSTASVSPTPSQLEDKAENKGTEKMHTSRPRLKAEAQEFEPSSLNWRPMHALEKGRGSTSSIPRDRVSSSTSGIPRVSSGGKSAPVQQKSEEKVVAQQSNSQSNAVSSGISENVSQTPSSHVDSEFVPAAKSVSTNDGDSIPQQTVPFGNSWATLASSTKPASSAPRLKVVTTTPAPTEKKDRGQRRNNYGNRRGQGDHRRGKPAPQHSDGPK